MSLKTVVHQITEATGFEGFIVSIVSFALTLAAAWLFNKIVTTLDERTESDRLLKLYARNNYLIDRKLK